MASIVLFRRDACPPLPRPATPRGRFGRRLAALLRGALARRRLLALGDRHLRDIGLERRDLEDPLAACRRARAWAEQGSAGWVAGSGLAARR